MYSQTILHTHIHTHTHRHTHTYTHTQVYVCFLLESRSSYCYTRNLVFINRNTHRKDSSTHPHTLAGELQAIVSRRYRTQLKHANASRVRTSSEQNNRRKRKLLQDEGGRERGREGVREGGRERRRGHRLGILTAWENNGERDEGGKGGGKGGEIFPKLLMNTTPEVSERGCVCVCLCVCVHACVRTKHQGAYQHARCRVNSQWCMKS